MYVRKVLYDHQCAELVLGYYWPETTHITYYRLKFLPQMHMLAMTKDKISLQIEWACVEHYIWLDEQHCPLMAAYMCKS